MCLIDVSNSINNQNGKYYNGGKLLKSGSNFLFTMGSRGSGKSYFYKMLCIKYFLKSGRKFVYMRRFISELDKIKEECFQELNFGNEKDIKGEVNIVVEGYDIFINGEKAGVYVGLSSYNKFKSVNMSEYDLIIFDEYLPEDEKYLKLSDFTYEPTCCLNFYQSVARGYNMPIREEVKFIFISNTINTFNPYSSFFKFDLEIFNGQKFINRDFFSVEVFKNNKINNEILKTAFGRFINTTEYGSYALNNKFMLDNNNLLQTKFERKKPLLYLRLENKTYTLYYQNDNTIVIDKNKEQYKFIEGIYNYNLTFRGGGHIFQQSNYFKHFKALCLQGLVKGSSQEAIHILKNIVGVN